MMFIGTDGVVFEGDAYCASPAVYPLEKFTEVKQAMVDGYERVFEHVLASALPSASAQAIAAELEQT